MNYVQKKFRLVESNSTNYPEGLGLILRSTFAGNNELWDMLKLGMNYN